MKYADTYFTSLKKELRDAKLAGVNYFFIDKDGEVVLSAERLGGDISSRRRLDAELGCDWCFFDLKCYEVPLLVRELRSWVVPRRAKAEPYYLRA